MKEDKIVEFKCIPNICTYNSEDFKIYGVDVDLNKYPHLRLNEYNNVSILGNIHNLGIGIEYFVKAKEEIGKRGYQYKVLNIRRERPTDSYGTRMFLSEILTYNQVEVLMSVYPDIVSRVINNRLDDIDLSLTHGIKEYTFNVIKNKIIENFIFAELIDEFMGLIDFNTLKKLYEKYPSVTRIRQELRENPYKCLCQLSRVGFKTADGILLEYDRESKLLLQKGQNPPFIFDFELKNSYQRAKAALIYLLEENENEGNTKIDIVKLRDGFRKLVPSCTNHFVDIIKMEEEIHYDKTTKYVALKSTYDTEFYIANRIISGLKSNEIWEIDIEKYRIVDDIELTDQQFKALDNLKRHNISILNGYAGTGKTQTTNTMIRMLQDKNKTFKLFAPTGRASKVLAGYTKQPAYTIHRGLGYLPPEGWSYNEENKLTCDAVIIDEFSMVDIFLMDKLIRAIDFQKTKLLIIGDSAQIPSVGAGNILSDLINSNLIPITTLTKVFRYSSGGLMTIATKTRNGESFIDDNETEMKIFGDGKDYIFIPINQEKIIRSVKALYEKLISQGNNPEDMLILSAYNKGDYGTVAINNEIQKIANKNYGDTNKFVVGSITYYESDLVIQTVNNYKAEIYNEFENEDPFDFNNEESRLTFISNGDIGKVILIKRDFMVVEFDDVKIKYNKSEALQLKLGYSISCHKSQGGAAKIIILITPKAHTFMLNSNILYVGETRARQKVYHFGSPATVNKAIKKQVNFNRDTFLKDLLKNFLN